MMNLNPRTEEAYQLFHNGILALSRAESQGIRVDVEYIQNKRAHLTRKIERLERQFGETAFYKKWADTQKGIVNIHSHTQLSNYLYKIKRVRVLKETASGQGSTDEDTLKQLNIPELEKLLEIRKLKKVRDTYLDSYLREQVGGVIHPFFNLHLVKSFRSCIAQGTKILAVRDFIKYPNGIPIEEIRQGDYVYCFDDYLKPSIQKVLWAGKTGNKKIIRIHYSVKGGHGGGYLDITPEHKIRLIDGSYEQAQNLVGDFREDWEKEKKLQKIRTLSCARVKDKLNFTGHLKGGKGIQEHKLIYSELIGKLGASDIIHHKNGNHLDHTPSNLEKMTLSSHSKYHVQSTLRSSKAIANNKIAIQKAKNNGVYKLSARRGKDAHNYLDLSKFTCYKLLAEVAGHLTKVKYDFSTFKKYLQLYHIDFNEVLLRYDKHGNYIWKKELKDMIPYGREYMRKKLGHNYYRLIKLLNFYNLPITKKWANQFGEFKPGNHSIIKVEWLNQYVDVYDIKTEKYHNFFANEICVHNSSDSPNLQNVPKRDEETMQMVRGALYPRLNHQLLEIDFKALEVAISCCYNKDSNLIKYIKDPATDMHADMAKQIFMLDRFDKEKHNVLRQAAKNGFVFPEFYGDYFINCAENMACGWGKLSKGRWKKGEGIEFDNIFLSDHLISKGIGSLKQFEKHIEKIEDDFWGNRFEDYARWKDRWWNTYRKYGYFDLLTGFRCSGVMTKNEVINMPVQGSAFHCLLWSFIEMDKFIIKNKLDSKLIGQVHDSMLFDILPDELPLILKKVYEVTTIDLLKVWDWIIVPLAIEAEIAPVNKSWAEKEKIDIFSQ